MIEILTSIKDWVCNSIFKPTLGTYWAELALLILFIVFLMLTVSLIIVSCYLANTTKSYHALEEKNSDLQDALKLAKSDNIDLRKTNAELEKNNCITKHRLEEIINLKDSEIKDLVESSENKDITINELNLKVKRLQAARKATRTIAAKKKKQLEELTNISENTDEVVD